MAHKPCITAGFVIRLLFHECGKPNFVYITKQYSEILTRYRWSYMLTNCSHLFRHESYFSYTHFWTKLYTEVVSWISGALCMALTQLQCTICTVCEYRLPLSVIVRSCHVCITSSLLRVSFMQTLSSGSSPSLTGGWTWDYPRMFTESSWNI